jgi:NADPH2:quinone reductase
MHSLVLERYDAPFTHTTMVRPAPRKGEVLVRIRASGVNPLDLKIRSGNVHIAGAPLIRAAVIAAILPRVGLAESEIIRCG